MSENAVVWEAGQNHTVIEAAFRAESGEREFVLRLKHNDSGIVTTIACKGVVYMNLKDWPVRSGGCTGFIVYDVSKRQLEGIRYEVEDYENGYIAVSCGHVTVQVTDG